MFNGSAVKARWLHIMSRLPTDTHKKWRQEKDVSAGVPTHTPDELLLFIGAPINASSFKAAMFDGMRIIGDKANTVHRRVLGSASLSTTILLGSILLIVCCLPVIVTYLGRDEPVRRGKSKQRSSPPPPAPAASAAQAPAASAFSSQEPHSGRGTPNRAQAAQERKRYSDLVVPHEWQCILRVPMRPLTEGPFDVLDPSDERVVRVTQGRRSSNPIFGDSVLFRLQTDSAEELASCSFRGNLGQDPEFFFTISRVDEPYHAKLSKVDGQYTVDTPWERWFLVLSPHLNRATVTNDSGKEVAMMEPDSLSAYYKLQVQPLSDVGLVLCVLLCVSHVAQS